MSAAVAALTVDKDFNFSRYILGEMRSNLAAVKKREVFMMYPRFLQIILDAKYPELVHSGETYDVKALGPSTFVLMKQARKVSKDAFQGLKPLEVFGIFAEFEGAVPPPTSATPPTSTAPPATSTAAPTTSTAPPATSSYTPVAIVAEEHVQPPKQVMRFEIDDDSDDSAGVDDETLAEFSSGSETESDVDASKTQRVLSEEEQAFHDELSKSAPSPPRTDVVSHESPRSASPPQIKRRRKDPRPGVFVPPASSAQPTPSVPPTENIPEHPDAPTIEDYMSEDEEKEEERVAADKATLASGSSSSQGPSQGPPQDPHLDATLRLAQHLATHDEDRPSQAGIHIGADKGKQPARDKDQIIHDLEGEVAKLKQQAVEKDILIGTLDVKVSDLTKEVSFLQANMGALTALIYDLKAKLARKFGDEFDTPLTAAAAPPPSSQPQPSSAHPSPDDALEKYLSSVPATAEESRAKQKRKVKRLAKKKGKSFVSKSADQNHPDETPPMFIADVDKARFVDEFGDRSGIRMWGFDRSKNLWVVKRKKGNIEYFAKESDFFSMTKVDLAELTNAPFINPYNVKKANGFLQVLKKHSKTNFQYLNLAESFTVEYPDVFDPRTGKPFKTVMWHPTKKQKLIPVSKALPDGTLKSMDFWCVELETANVLIIRNKDQIRLFSPRDLLMFGELDIHTLSRHQIICKDAQLESYAKEYTAMVARIIHGKWWAGSLVKNTDAALIDL